MKKFLLASLFLLGLCWQADAATCFWVGGAASWTSANTASWASSTGGTASTCAATGGVPINSGDTATIDANSGNATITVNGNFTGPFNLVMSGGTSTLDFSVNNNTIGLTQMLITAGTITMGSATFNTTTACATAFTYVNFTGATVNRGTATINATITGSVKGSIIFNGGGKTLPTVAFTTANSAACEWVITGNNTFAALTLSTSSQPLQMSFPSGGTQTVQAAYTWTGTSSAPILAFGPIGGTAVSTISTPTGSGGSWVGLSNLTATTTTPSFTNCLNFGGLSSITCSAPVVGGGSGVGIIGGGI